MADSLPFDIDEEDGSEQNTLAASVLVVDDELVVRDVFARLLSREADLSVECVESAEAALRLLKTRKFELMVTDKNLPGMGGVELISRARALRPGLEAVMITGYATSESLLAALAAGAVDYLTKPFDDLKVVRAKLRAALERRVQKVKGRERTRALAKEAQALLKKGREAKDQSWDALDHAFAAYEAAIRDGGTGRVVVHGRAEAVTQLRSAGLSAEVQGPGPIAGDPPAVIVLDTARPVWREECEALVGHTDADVLLLASPEAGLSDLLEALALHLDLVGFGLTHEAGLNALPARVRGQLMQRAVQRAQARLAEALQTFRSQL